MQGARLDRHLNLVVPVDDTSLGTVHVFHTPISYATFERYYRVMGRAWALTASMGGSASGPRIAALELRRCAQEAGEWDDPPNAPGTGVENGLVAEIRRLTNVVCPAAGGGWEPIPLMDARAAGTIDEEDLRDIEGMVTFFTLASRMQSARSLVTTSAALGAFFGAQTTSLNYSDWIASLPKSNGTGTSPPPPPTGSGNAIGFEAKGDMSPDPAPKARLPAY